MFPPIKLPRIDQSDDDLPLDRPRQSGFTLKPIDKDAALQMLDSFQADSDPEEDRETLAVLEKAINEHRTVVTTTGNVGHLSLFVPAKNWQDIQ